MISHLHPPDCDAIHFCCSKNNLSGKIGAFIYQFSSVQSLSCVQIFATPWTVAHRILYPSPNPGACSNSCPWSQWCHPTNLSSVIPFSSCLQSFPASESFPMSQFFPSGDQSIGASASVLPMNSHGWFPLGLTALISLQSKGLSWVLSRPRSAS